MTKANTFLQKILDGIAKQVGVSIVLTLFTLLGVGYGVIRKLDKLEVKIDSLAVMEKTKANKEALNHMANWMKFKEVDTLNKFNKGRVDVYFDLVCEPPEKTRGDISMCEYPEYSFFILHKAIWMTKFKMSYTNREK
jgi:hypothetical protein